MFVFVSCLDTVFVGGNTEGNTFQRFIFLSPVHHIEFVECVCFCLMFIMFLLLQWQGKINFEDFIIPFTYFKYLRNLYACYNVWILSFFLCLVGTIWKNREAADGGWYS